MDGSPRDGVKVTGRALSCGAGPESNGNEGSSSGQPYDVLCAVPRGTRTARALVSSDRAGTVPVIIPALGTRALDFLAD
jgi:hypothetical protein